MLITQYYKTHYKLYHKEMKQLQSVIKTVKGANNQCRDNENNRSKRIAKKTQNKTKTKQRQKGARGTEAIVKV